MSDDQHEPEDAPEPKRKPIKPAPKRGDLERLLNKAGKQPSKQRQRQQSAKPPPMRHQRRGR
jgi:hypothetical protein